MLDGMYTYWVKNFDAETSKTEQGGFTGENGELTIACEGGYEPFSYVNEDGDSGYDVDFVYGSAANTATRRTSSVWLLNPSHRVQNPANTISA